jgi:hypothetical protein
MRKRRPGWPLWAARRVFATGIGTAKSPAPRGEPLPAQFVGNLARGMSRPFQFTDAGQDGLFRRFGSQVRSVRGHTVTSGTMRESIPKNSVNNDNPQQQTLEAGWTCDQWPLRRLLVCAPTITRANWLGTGRRDGNSKAVDKYSYAAISDQPPQANPLGVIYIRNKYCVCQIDGLVLGG